MSKVEFQYSQKRGGRTVSMSRRYAETLRKLGHGTYPDATAAVLEPPKDGILISYAVEKFATENGIDVTKIIGTGKGGRINKSDIENAIKAQDLV